VIYEMLPFPMTSSSYWCSIVTMALSCIVSDIFNVQQWRALVIWVRGHSRSLKMAPFHRSNTSYQSAVVSLALSCTIFETLDLKIIVSLWVTHPANLSKDLYICTLTRFYTLSFGKKTILVKDVALRSIKLESLGYSTVKTTRPMIVSFDALQPCDRQTRLSPIVLSVSRVSLAELLT